MRPIALEGLTIRPEPAAPPLHDVLVESGNELGRLDIGGHVFRVHGPSELEDHGMLASGQFGRVHHVTHRCVHAGGRAVCLPPFHPPRDSDLAP